MNVESKMGRKISFRSFNRFFFPVIVDENVEVKGNIEFCFSDKFNKNVEFMLCNVMSISSLG